MSVRWSPLSPETVHSVQARKCRRRRNYWLRKARHAGKGERDTYVSFAKAAHTAFLNHRKRHRAYRGAPLYPFTRHFSSREVRP